MIIKKLISIVLAFVNITLLFSVLGFCEESQSVQVKFSERLKEFLANNSGYATFEYVDGEELVSTNRLVISTNSNEPIENDMGAVDKLEGNYNWHFFQYSSKDAVTDAYQYYVKQDYVNYVEADEVVEIYEPVEMYSSENQSSAWFEETIEVAKAKDALENSGINLHETLVAVVDSGLDTSHPFFDDPNNKSKLVLGKNELDNIPYPTKHGTKVAGVVFNNTTQNVKIRPYNCTTVLFPDGIIRATTGTIAAEFMEIIEDKEYKFDVINLSIVSASDKNTLRDAINLAVSKNICVVVSAGNTGDIASQYNQTCYDNSIVVSSITQNLIPRDDSCYGNVVDIAAPGENIPTICPDGDYGYINRTSAAAPFVSAAAAMIKSIDPDCTPAEIEELIKSTAFVPEGWDTENYGAGIVNFMNILEAMVQTTEKPKIEFIKNDKHNPEKAVITSSPNAKIYYTTNNTEPIVGKSALYTEPIDVTGLDIIKVVAVEDGMLSSETVSQTIDITVKKTVRYKGSLELPAAKRSDFKSCYVAKEDIVTYEGDGTIKAHKVGKTDVIVFVNCGKKVTYEITVEYEWWQRWIRIFLLGFLWY